MMDKKFSLIGLTLLALIITRSTSTLHDIPDDFPPGIDVALLNYSNWAKEIQYPDVAVATPKTPEEIVTIVNWAVEAGYKVRPIGAIHGFSPLILPYAWTNYSVDHTILIDGKPYLQNMEILNENGNPCDRVRVQPAATLEMVGKFLETYGCTLYPSYPSSGDITIGGTLAVNAHGTGVSSKKEPESSSLQWGTICSLVTSFEAVVSVDGSPYEIRRFNREDPEAAVFFTGIGRTILTSVDLLTVPIFNLRAQSFLDIPMEELLAPSDGEEGKRTFTHFIEESGRFDLMWYPFTTTPWVKVLSREDVKPEESREVDQPYNYPFLNDASDELVELVEQVATSAGYLTPFLGQAMFDYTVNGLAANQSEDIWGNAINIQLFALPSNVRVTSYGWEILCSRTNAQSVLKTLMDKFDMMMEDYRSRDMYPINGPCEIRVGGLDTTFESTDPSTASHGSLFSTRSPLKDCPHYDMVVTFTLTTNAKTPNIQPFMSELEKYVFDTYPREEGCPREGVARPSWSKGIGINPVSGPWTDETMMHEIFPSLFDDWEFVMSTMAKYDSHHIYSNELVDNLSR